MLYVVHNNQGREGPASDHVQAGNLDHTVWMHRTTHLGCASMSTSADIEGAGTVEISTHVVRTIEGASMSRSADIEGAGSWVELA